MPERHRRLTLHEIHILALAATQRGTLTQRELAPLLGMPRYHPIVAMTDHLSERGYILPTRRQFGDKCYAVVVSKAGEDMLTNELGRLLPALRHVHDNTASTFRYVALTQRKQQLSLARLLVLAYATTTPKALTAVQFQHAAGASVTTKYLNEMEQDGFLIAARNGEAIREAPKFTIAPDGLMALLNRSAQLYPACERFAATRRLRLPRKLAEVPHERHKRPAMQSNLSIGAFDVLMHLVINGPSTVSDLAQRSGRSDRSARDFLGYIGQFGLASRGSGPRQAIPKWNYTETGFACVRFHAGHFSRLFDAIECSGIRLKGRPSVSTLPTRLTLETTKFVLAMRSLGVATPGEVSTMYPYLPIGDVINAVRGAERGGLISNVAERPGYILTHEGAKAVDEFTVTYAEQITDALETTMVRDLTGAAPVLGLGLSQFG